MKNKILTLVALVLLVLAFIIIAPIEALYGFIENKIKKWKHRRDVIKPY